MSYAVKILADSITPPTLLEDPVRLTTMEIVLPRFLLAELNTHRMFSRNSASSRAKKPEDIIKHVLSDPFVPSMNKRVKGMGVGESLNGPDANVAEQAWLFARDKAVIAAQILITVDCDKSRINRLLEPFMWHTAIVSATEWENFFALRDHPAAQPEFQHVARMMKDAMAASSPIKLSQGQWHLPLVNEIELGELCADHNLLTMFKMVSAGRCARVSYDTQDNYETREASYKRSEILMGNGHFSPFEHVARPWSIEEYGAAENAAGQYRDDCAQLGWKFDHAYYNQFFFSGNFKCWIQMRKEVPNEANFGKVGV